MQEESKNVSPIVRAETLGVFSSFTSHPFLPAGARCEGSCQVQRCIVFLLSINKEEQHATTY